MDPELEKLQKEEMEKKAKMSRIARIKCIYISKEKRYGRKGIDSEKIIYFFWKVNFSR